MRKKFKDTKVQIRSRNEGQAIQWPKKKRQTMIYKTLHKKLNIG